MRPGGSGTVGALLSIEPVGPADTAEAHIVRYGCEDMRRDCGRTRSQNRGLIAVCAQYSTHFSPPIITREVRTRANSHAIA